MHVQLSPDAPLLLRIAATSVLDLHIAAGCVGLASGFAAIAFRKGGRLHRLTGTVFFVSMLTNLGIGAVMSPVVGQPMNLFGGSYAIYLLISGWATVRRKGGGVGRLEKGVLALPFIAAPVLLAGGWIGAHSPHGLIDNVPYQAAYIAASLCAMTAILDIKVMLQGGISGVARVTRHLWRMCTALFFASGSLFLGQQQVFPKALQGSPILAVVAVAPLVLMLFWLLRVRFARAFHPARPLRVAAIQVN